MNGISTSKTRILVVDDSKEILEVFSAALRIHGFEVFEAQNGLQALQCVHAQSPDLVLLDVMLPDMSGIEVCRQIKNNPQLQNVFVMLISGEAMSVNQKVSGFDIGADDYLTKPIALSEFIARIRTLVRLQQTNAALRASEEHYRRLVDILPDAVLLIDVKGRIMAANPRAVTILGYDNAAELVGARAFKLARREEWQRIDAGLQALQTTEVMWHGECNAVRKDAAQVPVDINATTLIDAKGTIRGVLLVARDLTERRWAENAMQVQRDFGIFLSSIREMKPALEWLLQVAMQYGSFECGAVYLEDSKSGSITIEAQSGLTAKCLRRASRFAPDSREATQFRKGCAEWFAEVMRIPGESPLLLTSAPILHGDKIVALLVLGSRTILAARAQKAIEKIAAQAGDAIARIRVEQSLRTNRQLLEKTLHSIRSAVFVVDTATDRILECNPAASAIFGYSKDELLGARTNLLHVNNLLWRHFRHQMRTELKETGAVRDFELQMKRKDGSLFPAEHSIVFTQNDSGRIINSVIVIRNIQTRKRFEEELLGLPNRIMEAQEAERKRVARELHDGVNQLIASAKMRLQKVEERVVSINPAAKELLSRAFNLMVQALEENRRIAHNLRPSDLDELGLASACQNFCNQVQARTNLRFFFDFDGQRHRLPQEAELHLFRILQEAVNNIEKHAKAQTVHVKLTVRSESVILRIKDDGCGLPSAPSAPKDQWSGMGLTNMKERASLLKGTFDVTSSSENGGTTITITAPCQYRKDVLDQE